MRASILFACLFAVAALAARISYDGQQILQCHFDDPTVISKLQEEVDVWGVLPGGLVDVRAKTAAEKELIASLTTDCVVTIPDLEADVQKFEGLNLEARNRLNADWFDAYHTYNETVTWYNDVATKNPSLVTWVNSIGTTAQGRTQPAIRIFDRTTNSSRTPVRRIYFQAQIHAREWISGATVQYIVNQTLVAFQSNDALIRNVLSTTEIVVVPFTNPDGYVFTWSGDRLWRKNRRTNTGSTCIGADNNRNYNDHWGQGGSSTNPCSDTFMGPSVASENENKNTQTYFKELQKTAPIIGAIDWHSYSQLVLRPYGWTSANSPDEAVFKTVGDRYRDDIRASTGRVYTSQKSIELYVTTGSASDWFYGTDAFAGNQGYRVYSYTIELRPAGSPPGFELPPAEIVPTGRENWAAIRNWLDYVVKNPIYRP
jgi:murein tripeptide amidase MpaA